MVDRCGRRPEEASFRACFEVCVDVHMNGFKIRIIFDTFFLINQAFYWVNLVINGSITGQKMVCNWSVYDQTVTVFCPVGFLMWKHLLYDRVHTDMGNAAVMRVPVELVFEKWSDEMGFEL